MPVARPESAVPLILPTVVASVPEVVTSPDRSPLVTEVAPENFVRLPVAGLPVVVTVPEPAGVAQVPSPRQKVVDDAEVPLFRLPTGRLPVTPPLPLAARLAAGTTAAQAET